MYVFNFKLIINWFCLLRLASMSWIMAAGLIVNAAMGVSHWIHFFVVLVVWTDEYVKFELSVIKHNQSV
jgi:hypothetical protein